MSKKTLVILLIIPVVLGFILLIGLGVVAFGFAVSGVWLANAPAADGNNNSRKEPVTEADQDDGGDGPSTVPDELIGKWANGRTGSSIRNAYGQTVASSGSRVTYQFSPNGAVEFVGIIHTSSLAGCQLEAFTTKKGRVSIDGDEMSIAWAPASFSRDDTCSPEKNYKKSLPAETEKVTWRAKHEENRTQLCMESKDGETCYDKTEEEKSE
jgi:hypothetical protein